MRTIVLPAKATDALLSPQPGVLWLAVPVLVDWFPPLTEAQMMANALACCNGERDPYPDPNFIEVRLPYPTQEPR